MSRRFDGTTPIYVQLAEEIRAQILAGELAEGDRLTSTTEYAARDRINPATANKAISRLVSEGLVVKERGIGMFVADGARSRLAAARRGGYVDEVLAPALDAGRVLGLSDADLLDAVQTHLSSRASATPAPSGSRPRTDDGSHPQSQPCSYPRSHSVAGSQEES